MGSFAPIAHPCLSVMSLWNKPLCKASKGASEKEGQIEERWDDGKNADDDDWSPVFVLTVRCNATVLVSQCCYFEASWVSPDKIDDFRGPLDWSGQIWQFLKPDVRSGQILVKSAHAWCYPDRNHKILEILSEHESSNSGKSHLASPPIIGGPRLLRLSSLTWKYYSLPTGGYNERASTLLPSTNQYTIRIIYSTDGPQTPSRHSVLQN